MEIFLNTSRKIFSLINLSLTSNEETKKYLQDLRVKNVHFNGNLKLINKIDQTNKQNLNEKFLLNNKFWFAASTHRGEEILCLKVHLNVNNRLGNVVTIIAPRHIARVKEIEQLCNDNKLTSQILNNNDVIEEGKEVIIINSLSVKRFFKYTKSTFIGKSTIKSLK